MRRPRRLRRAHGLRRPAPLLPQKGAGHQCRSPGSADQLGLLTTDVDSKRRVGVNLCLELRCNERLEAAANLSGRSVLDDNRQLLEYMSRFASEALGIEVGPGA